MARKSRRQKRVVKQSSRESWTLSFSPSDKTVDRLLQEARTLVGAGAETAGGTLDTITFHLLSNPHILEELKAELTEAFPYSTDSISVRSSATIALSECSNH